MKRFRRVLEISYGCPGFLWLCAYLLYMLALHAANHCPDDRKCEPIKNIFKSSTNFCENIFRDDFKVEKDGSKCMTFDFSGPANPNAKVRSTNFSQLVANTDSLSWICSWSISESFVVMFFDWCDWYQWHSCRSRLCHSSLPWFKMSFVQVARDYAVKMKMYVPQATTAQPIEKYTGTEAFYCVFRFLPPITRRRSIFYQVFGYNILSNL